MSAEKPSESRQWREARRWLDRADEDLRAAEALLGIDPPAVASAAFHCHQAAEKMAKGTLIGYRQAPPRIHDIEELGRRLEPHDQGVAKHFAALGGITRWYTSVRYPDTGVDETPPTVDVKDVLAQLHRVRAQIEVLASKP